MLKFIKKNKTLFILILLTVIASISGSLFNAFLDTETKKEIANNINQMMSTLSQTTDLKMIVNTFLSNFSLISLIWLLGISIIGIPIILFLYLLKVFILFFETISLISNLGLTKFLFIILYILPSLINIIIYFFLVYYSLNFSRYLIKIIFLKRDYNFKIITKRYTKIYLIVFLLMLITTLLESLLIPKILFLLLK